MASNNGYTPTEKRLMDVLGDWRPHTKAELRAAIDEMADDNQLQFHISNLREKLEVRSLNVMSRYRDGTYQLVSTIPPNEE